VGLRDARVSNTEGSTARRMQDNTGFFLAVNPDAVHLAPGSLKRGAASVARIRQAARDVGDWDLAAFWKEGRSQEARERPWPRERVVHSAPVTDRAEENALEALLNLPPGVHRPDRLPRTVWQVLERELPKGGLRSLLVARADLFDVLETRDSKGYTFVVRHRPWPTSAAASSGLGDGQPASDAQESRDQDAGVGALEKVVAEPPGASTIICSQQSCTRPSQTQCPWCLRHFCGLHEETCKRDSERCWALWRALSERGLV